MKCGIALEIKKEKAFLFFFFPTTSMHTSSEMEDVRQTNITPPRTYRQIIDHSSVFTFSVASARTFSGETAGPANAERPFLFSLQ